jgi:hypothetical protein
LVIMRKLICLFLSLLLALPALAFANDKKCSGVRLNTNVPFIGNCIEFEDKSAEKE